MTISPAAVQRLENSVGDLLARHAERRNRVSFEPYRDDPVGFIRQVLKGEPWSAQEEIAVQVRDHPFVVVRSCNGAGKDWLAARLALWWVYARGGLVLITGPTERQVKTVVMGEVHRAFAAAKDLPGELYEMALRVARHEQGGILAFTSSDLNRVTGFHAPKLMAIVTEAQGVPGFAWEGVLACTTGEESKIVAVGNPLSPEGKFFDICRSDTWSSIKLSAFDHPNLQEQREVIPGSVTQRFVDTIATEYGSGSGIYQARVLGEFPDESEESLVQRRWLAAAAERWDERALEAQASELPFVAALDPARFGVDRTVLALRQGPILRELIEWRNTDTMATCGKVALAFRERGLDPGSDRPRYEHAGPFRVAVFNRAEHVSLTVDEVGVGSGVLDRFSELGYQVTGFNGGRSPGTETFLNLRAEAFWGLRQLLELGHIALPRDEKLFDELAGIKWRVNSAGKIQLESKDDTRARLGRSPDRADAVAMAFHGMYQPRSQQWQTFKWAI